MVDYVLPANPPPADVEWRILDNTAADAPGPWGGMQTVTRPGARWACRISWQNLNAANRHKLMSLVASLRGRANRLWVNDITATLRGSMSAPELLTNSDFSNGTTGWNSNDTADITAANGTLRVKRKKGGGGSSEAYQNVALPVLNAPYALRSVIESSRWLSANLVGPAINDSVRQVDDYQTARGLRTASVVALGTSSAPQYPVVAAANAVMPGAFVDLQFASLARCFLADAGPNLLTYSDQFDNAAWSKIQLSIVGNDLTAPDGTGTADRLTPTAVSGQHYAFETRTVSSAVQEFVICGAFKANGYSFVRLQLSNGSGSAYQIFNLATGALGATAATGTGWDSRRAFIVSMGDGWYYCAVVARKTDAATSLDSLVVVHSADSVADWTGNGTSGIHAWRATGANSALPVRLIETTATAISAPTQTGAGIHVKGLPASANGVLAAGDPVEIIAGTRSHYARLTSDLDSDAAGRGYMQIEPPCPWQISDNAPVIVQKPMVKMMLADGDVAWPTRPGIFSDFSIDLVQDPT